MSKDYSLTEALGVLFIFGSIIPLLFSISALSMFSPINILLLMSPMLMVMFGWGLVKKRNWARGGSIFLMLFGLIYAFYQYWFLGAHLLGVPVIIVILGILLFDKNRSQSSQDADETSNLTSTMNTI